ncbi:uncharacterized protein [Physcomitrium patens]|uniref:uncharacterized protein isoform X2 n=1 Tax=Physcomitrium patens TaxID=3218 RepID=UPI003CCD3F67
MPWLSRWGRERLKFTCSCLLGLVFLALKQIAKLSRPACVFLFLFGLLPFLCHTSRFHFTHDALHWQSFLSVSIFIEYRVLLGELSRFAGVQASAVDASSVFKDLFSGMALRDCWTAW